MPQTFFTKAVCGNVPICNTCQMSLRYHFMDISEAPFELQELLVSIQSLNADQRSDMKPLLVVKTSKEGCVHIATF